MGWIIWVKMGLPRIILSASSFSVFFSEKEFSIDSWSFVLSKKARALYLLLIKTLMYLSNLISANKYPYDVLKKPIWYCCIRISMCNPQKASTQWLKSAASSP